MQTALTLPSGANLVLGFIGLQARDICGRSDRADSQASMRPAICNSYLLPAPNFLRYSITIENTSQQTSTTSSRAIMTSMSSGSAGNLGASNTKTRDNPLLIK